jgi:hypothetical protein
MRSFIFFRPVLKIPNFLTTTYEKGNLIIKFYFFAQFQISTLKLLGSVFTQAIHVKMYLMVPVSYLTEILYLLNMQEYLLKT